MKITVEGLELVDQLATAMCAGCEFRQDRGTQRCDAAEAASGMSCRDIIWVRPDKATSAPSKLKSIYVIGSLRNDNIPKVAAELRKAGLDVFDDWYSAGPEADDYWKKYEEGRGHDYYQALQGHAATHVFGFDQSHLDRCDCAVLILPAGRSGHLEAGWVAGKGKPVFILHDNPDRWDVMYRFATAVVPDVATLLTKIKEV